jgi:hypothetical protein
MDVDPYIAKLHNLNIANIKATISCIHINSFMDEMASMVSYGFPYPWNY